MEICALAQSTPAGNRSSKLGWDFVVDVPKMSLLVLSRWF
jgi:hypothetical protein